MRKVETQRANMNPLLDYYEKRITPCIKEFGLQTLGRMPFLTGTRASLLYTQWSQGHRIPNFSPTTISSPGINRLVFLPAVTPIVMGLVHLAYNVYGIALAGASDRGIFRGPSVSLDTREGS